MGGGGECPRPSTLLKNDNKEKYGGVVENHYLIILV